MEFKQQTTFLKPYIKDSTRLQKLAEKRQQNQKTEFQIKKQCYIQ